MSSCESLEHRTLLTAYIVDSNADDPADDGTLADGRLTLREAITAANTNAWFGDAEAGSGSETDTITFAASLAGRTITLGGVQLAITDHLTITGLGATQLTISGNDVSRVFSAESGVIAEISNLTVTRGSAANGGGIFNAGTLSLTNAVVSTNSAGLGGQGGGVYNEGFLTITTSNFSANVAAGIGFGGGLYNLGMASIAESSFIDNMAGTGEGGAINNAAAGTLSFIDGSVSGSSADFGGGILNAGSLSVENSALFGNFGSGSGGAISNRGFMSINRSQLTGNSAGQGGAIANGTQAGATVTDSTISGNSASATGVVPFGIGGGLFNSGGGLALENCTISGNTADFGGGIAVGIPMLAASGASAQLGAEAVDVQAILPQLVLSNTTVSGNTAARSGGGIYQDGQTQTILRNVTIARNRASIEATGSGGGIFVDGGSNPAILFNTIVAGNALFVGMPGTPNDVAGLLDSISSHNLIGDAASAGGITDGTLGNIVGVDWTTVIAPDLADSGGPTLTHALLTGSRARNAGDNVQALDALGNPLATDQRGIGFPRVVGAVVDIGAVEAAAVFLGKIDFNGDGLEDVAEMKTNGEWWVGLSDGVGSFTEMLWTKWASSSSWVDLDFGDFNGDGLTDIVGITTSGGVWVALSNGANGFRLATRWLAPQDATRNLLHVGVGDFDANGYADLAMLSNTGEWRVALSNSANSFALGSAIWDKWAEQSTWADIELGDFNGDGYTDVAGFTEGGFWWVGLNNGLGSVGTPDAGRFTHTRWAQWVRPSQWTDFEVGDFNGDGSDDIIGFHMSGDWYIGTSNGSAFDTGPFSARWRDQSAWGKISVGDFNDDGFTDIAGFSIWGGWWIGLNNTTGGFSTSRWAKWDPAASWAQMDLQDVNGSQNMPPDESGATDAVGFDQDGNWKVGVSNGTDSLVGDAFWAEWDPADTWATLNNALALRRQLDRLALV